MPKVCSPVKLDGSFVGFLKALDGELEDLSSFANYIFNSRKYE